MLPQLRFETHNKTIGETVGWVVRDDGYFPIDLNPSYQRGDVWAVDQQRNLIKSVLMGLPIGVVFINHRDPVNFTTPPRMVDGQQRMRALAQFMADEFTVPTAWVDDRDHERERAAARPDKREYYPSIDDDFDDVDVRFSQLTVRGQRSFKNKTLAVYETQLETEADEAELYLLLNFGGVPQTGEDRERAEAIAGTTIEALRARIQ